MPNQTTHYHLVKPLGTELYDVSVFNSNADTIDAALDNHDDLISDLTNATNSKVSKTGDTMTGDLNLQYGTSSTPVRIKLVNEYSNRSCLVQADSNGVTQVWNWKDGDNASWVNILPETSEGTSNEQYFVSLSVRKNGNTVQKKIFGEYNLSALATAINTLIQNGSINTVKSIVTGYKDIPTGSWAKAISVTGSPNLDKCIWIIDKVFPTGQPNVGYFKYVNIYRSHENNNQLYVVRDDSRTQDAVTVYWKVIEFY